MPMNSQDKVDLERTLATLCELDEPEALIGTLERLARRWANEGGDAWSPHKLRWRLVADKLELARTMIEEADQPLTAPDPSQAA